MKTECLRSLEIQDQFDLGDLLNSKVGRLLAFQNAANIDAGYAIGVGDNASKAHQAASLGKLLILKYRRQSLPQCQVSELSAVAVEESIRANHQSLDFPLRQVGKHLGQITLIGGRQELELDAKGGRHSLKLMGHDLLQ